MTNILTQHYFDLLYMYQKDYILRMIEMFGEMLAAIFGLIRKGSYKKASQALENAYMELLQQNSSELLQIQPAFE